MLDKIDIQINMKTEKQQLFQKKLPESVSIAQGKNKKDKV